nr:retrovirus-related Pol polyprotein from transposon TNT 1-94 [Tanacetum cinerariifolium]
LSKNDIVVGLPKLKFVKDHLCSSCTEFLNKTLHAYFASEGILHQTSVVRTPEQNCVVERRNRTLVEAARTMLSAAKVPLFFWVEAIATACFTQNHSLVIPIYEKTPYHIINDRKPSVKFFHIFGTLCYIVRDGENLDKMKEKGDACIFVGYSTQSRAYMVFNKRTRVIVEMIYVNFDELPQMVSDHVSSDPGPQCCVKVFAVTTVDAPNKRQQQHITSLSNQTTPDPTCQVPTQAPSVISPENMNQVEMVKEYAQVKNDAFINIFCTPVQDKGETSSLRTRRQLESDAEMCMFALTVSRTELKNIKEAMADSAWIESKQEELHQFDRLDEGIDFEESFALVARLEVVSVGTPMATKHLDADLSGTSIDQTNYRSM